jgi:hypothetical protein
MPHKVSSSENLGPALEPGADFSTFVSQASRTDRFMHGTHACQTVRPARKAPNMTMVRGIERAAE